MLFNRLVAGLLAGFIWTALILLPRDAASQVLPDAHFPQPEQQETKPLQASEAAVTPGQISADRPGFGSTPDLVPPGTFQTETGYSFGRIDQLRQHSFGEFLVRIAAGKRMELRLAMNSYRLLLEPEMRKSGIDDPTFGFKLKLMDASAETSRFQPKVSVLASAALPFGSKEIGEPLLHPEVRTILSWSLPKQMSFTTNLIYASDCDRGQRFSQFSGSAVLGWSAAPKVGLFVEYYGFVPETSDNTATKYFDTGVAWIIGNRLQVDIWGGVGRNVSGPEYFAGLGISRRWLR